MKKILMLSMLICGAMSGAWGGTCTPMLCNEADHDTTEMLTTDGVTGGKNNNSDSRFTSKNCFMCDTGGASECNYGDTVAIVDNWGNVKSAWQCTDDKGDILDHTDDDWLSFSMDTAAICGDSPLGNMDSNLQNAKNVQVREGEAIRGAVSIVINNSRRVSTLCKYRECKDGYKASSDGQSCVAEGNGGAVTKVTCDGSPVNTTVNDADLGRCKEVFGTDVAGVDKVTSCKKTCSDKGIWLWDVTSCANGWEIDTVPNNKVICKKKKQGGENSGVVGKCHPSVCQSEVCKACCAKPKEETIWDRGAQVCQCVNGGKFTKENNQWICKVDNSQQVVPSGQCDATLLARVQGWKTQCAGKTEVLAEIDGLLAYCAGKAVNNDVFLRLYDELKALVDKKCVGSSEQPPKPDDDSGKLRASLRIITDAHDTLNGISNGFKASVWKDEEGKFNTARLVSDSVAGVVLGTTGALVTSHVVKKNQVESGFEDIKCTIGGQVVADWGDQFRVGIQ